jgi:hypothetical protein
MPQNQIKNFSDLGINAKPTKFVGEKIRLSKILNVEIVVYDYHIKPSKYPEKGNKDCLWLQLSIDGKKHVAFSVAKFLMETIQKIPKEDFPFKTKIINDNEVYEFS